MKTETTIVERAAQPYVAIRTVVTKETLGAVVPPLNQEVFAWLARRGIAPSGPPFWKYNVIDMDRGLEVEAGVTVATPVAGDERVLAGVLPAGRYVTMHSVGHPEELIFATGGLLDWAAARALVWDVWSSPEGERWGCRLEIYHTDPADEPDMNKWDTQLAVRLADTPGDTRSPRNPSIPGTAVVRISRGNFEPARFAEVERMTQATGEYLIPAIERLEGLLSYYAGVSPDGSIVHVSMWQSDAHAQQMGRLREMIVDARAAADAVGVTFTPIVNYPIAWQIETEHTNQRR